MADLNVKLKKNGNILYPQTKTSLLLNDDGTKYNVPHPEAKTAEQTQVVSIDDSGKLYTTPAPEIKIATEEDIDGLFE